MINRLRGKFIFISTFSLLCVVSLVLILMAGFNISSMNKTLDVLADNISQGGGRFPDSFGGFPKPEPSAPDTELKFPFITPETRFSTRHFTVWLDEDGNAKRINTEFIYSITQDDAVQYAEKALNEDRLRGWISHYRYKVFSGEGGLAIVFIDGSTQRAVLLQSMSIAAAVLFGCAALVLFLIVLLSGRMVKPIAESYEKQKQFVTDANHELKTPLTLILTNLDIAEAELGKNEWLDDIRSEGHRMAELVGQLVALSRMDEESASLNLTTLSLSELVSDTASEFSALAENKGKALVSEIDPDISLVGDETLLRRLTAILLDNAVKYCDANGEIRIALRKRRYISLTVENTYRDVSRIELDRLFDRFYRADKARTFSGGYGIGLSIAKAIAQKHRGDVTSYKKDDTHIGFRVIFK